MGDLREYLVRLICCGIVCSILLSLVKAGSTRGILQLAAGVIMAITAIAPLGNWEIPDYLELPGMYLQNGYDAAAAGEAFAMAAREQIIKEELEAYILDKANAIGCSIAVQVHMTKEGYPDSVFIKGEIPESDRKRLENILEEDLGISKEQQEWSG